jgi:hypothetical protein
MRRSHLILVIAVGIEITVCASLVTFSVLAASKQSPDALRTAVYVPRMREPYRSEDQWIAGETVRAIMEMAAYARRQPITRADLDLLEVRHAANRAEAAVIMLRFSSRSFEIALQPYAWAPEAYERVAFTMLGGVTTPSRQDDLLRISGIHRTTNLPRSCCRHLHCAKPAERSSICAARSVVSRRISRWPTRSAVPMTARSRADSPKRPYFRWSAVSRMLWRA